MPQVPEESGKSPDADRTAPSQPASIISNRPGRQQRQALGKKYPAKPANAARFYPVPATAIQLYPFEITQFLILARGLQQVGRKYLNCLPDERFQKGAAPEENELNGKNQMETTAVIAASRQGALRRQLEIVANNLANMSTNGYKSSQMMFVEHVVKSKGGERLISPKLTYTRDIATRIDVTDGAIETTGNPLDMAIRNDGFFVVRDAQNKEFYTRNGQFRLDTNRQIVNQQGYALLSSGGQPITLGPNDAEINVGRDGTISTENGQLGKLRIVRFENTQDLARTSASLFTSDTQPVDVASPDIIQGALEGSNVEPILEMAKMIELHRNYESAKSFIEREDERQKEMIRGLARDA